jgi:xanthine dehydrogenase YagR molybdenum-binding subunit
MSASPRFPSAAAARAGQVSDDFEPRDRLELLNTDLRRLDGPQKVTGRAVYSHDVRLPRQVYARLVWAHAPRATIAAIDPSAARELPGVVLAEALPREGDRIDYLGADAVLAYVAAETPEAARDAARAVRFELTREQPTLMTPAQALEAEAPKLMRRGNASGERSRGDEAKTLAAIAAAEVRLEAVYELPVQHHVSLETHGCVVDYDGERATVYASTQMVSGSVGEFAQLLELPADRVRVVCEYMGGGFGAKFGAGLEGRVACLVARALKRPVHLLLDRPQEFALTGNRSGTRVEVRAGASREGGLVGLSMQVDRHGGMGQGSFPTPPYIYRVGESHSRVRAVHTAMEASVAMRAPGHPQASFAMESTVDELAYALGVDPLEFRKQNLADPVWHRQLDRVAAELGWGQHEHRTRPGREDARGLAEGIGFGITTWHAGGAPGAEAELRIHSDGSVVSACAVQDLGTGARTYVAAVPAEVLGLPLEAVQARIGDSDLPPGVGSGGSVTTGSVVPALQKAAHAARRALEERIAPALGIVPGELTYSGGFVTSQRDPALRLAFKDACALIGSQPVVGRGAFDAELTVRQGGLHGAQGVRVRVDVHTGRVQLLRMVAIHDTGLPLNRLALRSQINGGMIQALSYGLLEQRLVDENRGFLLSANLEAYKIAGSLEIPEMLALIDDEDDRPGVTGMAEAPVICGHAAIANAIFNACGARLRSLPFTPDRLLAALRQRPA